MLVIRYFSKAMEKSPSLDKNNAWENRERKGSRFCFLVKLFNTYHFPHDQRGSAVVADVFATAFEYLMGPQKYFDF